MSAQHFQSDSSTYSSVRSAKHNNLDELYFFVVLVQIILADATLTVSPNNVTVKVGNPATFQCTPQTATGMVWKKYEPMIILFKSDRNPKINDSTKYSYNVTDNNYLFTVVNPTLTDGAPYSCEDTQDLIETLANLQVVGKLFTALYFSVMTMFRHNSRFDAPIYVLFSEPRNSLSYKLILHRFILLWWLWTKSAWFLGNFGSMHKSKMAVEQHIQWYKGCHNSKTIKQNLIYNSSFSWYYDWLAWIIGLKQVKILYQYGLQHSKWPKKYKILRKIAIIQKLSNRFQYSISC